MMVQPETRTSKRTSDQLMPGTKRNESTPIKQIKPTSQTGFKQFIYNSRRRQKTEFDTFGRKTKMAMTLGTVTY